MRESIEQMVARINRNAFIAPDYGDRTMAKKIEQSVASSYKFTGSKAFGGEAKYPWDEWFDGELYCIERSSGPENDKGTIEEPTVVRDYGVPTVAMFPKSKTAARGRYKVVSMSRTGLDGKKLEDAIMLQARDMTKEERSEEDSLREIEKSDLKAYKAYCSLCTKAERKPMARKDYNAQRAKERAESNGAAVPPTMPAAAPEPPKPAPQANGGSKPHSGKPQHAGKR